jgi:hypothetical protein
VKLSMAPLSRQESQNLETQRKGGSGGEPG